MGKNAAPKHLSKKAKLFWRELTAGIQDVTDKELLILQSAMEAFDRIEQARKLIDENGMTVKDRFGQDKPNPACAIERDNRKLLNDALRALTVEKDVSNVSVAVPSRKRA